MNKSGSGGGRKPSGKGKGKNFGKRPTGKGGSFTPQKNSGRRPVSGRKRPAQEAPLPKAKDDNKIRLNRYVANAGICSRRDADTYIAAGNVTVNGKTITEMGYKVDRGDEVRFDGRLLSLEKKEYVLLNKPKNFITTTSDEKGRRTVMELVANASKSRLLPVGRLDRNTTGLLLFTNDGDLAKKLTHPKYQVRKIYHVVLDKNVTAADMRKIADGLTLEDGPVQVDEVAYVQGATKKEVGIEIHSGRNRIVRRIFQHLGYDVIKLDRVIFAGLTKKDLPKGHWRHLTEQEVNTLRMI